MTPSRPPLQCSLGSLIRTSRSKDGSRKKSKRVNAAVLENANPLMTPPKKEERRRFLFQSSGLIREKDVLTIAQIYLKLQNENLLVEDEVFISK